LGDFIVYDVQPVGGFKPAFFSKSNKFQFDGLNHCEVRIRY